MGPVLVAWGLVPGKEVYRSTFAKGKTDDWTSDGKLSPGKRRNTLAQLHNQTIRLSLPKLPAHKLLHVRLELDIIDTWDGSAQDGDGPDTITIKLAGGPTLLHASFAVVAESQSYPDNGLWARHRARTGQVRALNGYRAGGSVYSLSFTVPHADPRAVLEITGRLSESMPKDRTAANESWGVGNVVVSALAEPAAPLDKKTFAKLWSELAVRDPARANRAMWKLIAAGDRAADGIEEALSAASAKVDVRKVDALVKQLDEDDWRVRDSATRELKAMGSRVHARLRQVQRGKASPEVRSRIEDILSTGETGPDVEARRGRVRWALQVIGGKKAEAIRRTLPEPMPRRPPQPKVIDAIRSGEILLERWELEIRK
jgi:hypothetical protein